MVKYNYRRWIVWSILCVCGLICVSPLLISAQTGLPDEVDETAERMPVTTSDDKKQTINIQKASYWEDGVEFTQSNLDNGNINVKVSPDEQNQTDGSTLFIYDYTERNLSKNDAVSFYIENTSSELIYVSVVITPTNNQDYEVKLEDSAWLKAENQEDFEVIYNENSGFTIPANFSGEFYLPLKAFGVAGLNPFADVETIGLTLYVPADAGVLDFELGDIHFLKDSLSKNKDKLYQLELSGDDNITVPKTGAVMSVYQAEVVGNPGQTLSFYLEEDNRGVHISPDGKLVIDSTYNYPKSIEVHAKDPISGTSIRKLVKLDDMYSTLKALAVPLPSEVQSYNSDLYVKINAMSPYLRLFLAIVSFVFGGLVWYWWGTYKQYQATNFKQLNQQVKRRKRVR